MKELYGEGVANHSDPESCASTVRKGGREALTGARSGEVLSRESPKSDRGADAVTVCGKRNGVRRYREAYPGPARSETLCMNGTSIHGNREIPCSVAQVTQPASGSPRT